MNLNDLQSQISQVANMVAQEPQEQQVEQEQEQSVEQEESSASQEPVISEKERIKAVNFDNLREKNYRLEWERNEALRQLEEERRYKTQPKQAVEESEDDGIQDTDYLEKRQVKTIVDRKVNNKYRELEEKTAKLEKLLIEKQLQDDFPGFKSVVTEANLQKLSEIYPHHLRNLSHNPNVYDRGAAAYDLIKSLNISDSITQDRQSEQTRNTISKNLSKPKSASSISSQAVSPLAKANSYSDDLTPERKAQIYAEMRSINRNNGF